MIAKTTINSNNKIIHICSKQYKIISSLFFFYKKKISSNGKIIKKFYVDVFLYTFGIL